MIETKNPQTLLPEGYYLENLERLVGFVLQTHRSLLSQAEAQRATQLLSLSLPARRLYTRLYTRRGPLFLLSSISYKEIPDVSGAARELAQSGFVALFSTPSGPEEASLTFSLFNKEQLLPIVKRRFGSMANRLKKEQLLQALLDHPDDWAHLSTEPFLYMLDEHIFSLFEILFFGNRHQSLTDFILVDLAKISYFPYEITAQPIFTSRVELANYLQAAQVLQKSSELTTKQEALALVELTSPLLENSVALPAHQRLVDPRRYWQRAAFVAARECERQGDTATAKQTYEAIASVDADPHTQTEAIDRFGLLCKREKDAAALESLCQRAEARGDLDALSLYQLNTRRAKLSLCPDPKLSLKEAPVFTLELTPTGHQGAKATYQGRESSALSVELATLEALGGDGLWAENGLWLTLFGVLCWDVIFAPLPGVFTQPFQAGPLDLWSDSFYASRSELFAEKFRRLEGHLLESLAENDHKYRGYACHFTLWPECPLSLLQRVAKALGPRLLAIVKRIAQSPNRHSNGLPDLIVFEGDELRLIEVKGPGDSLRLAQRLWHDFLLRAGVRVELAKVLAPKAPKH